MQTFVSSCLSRLLRRALWCLLPVLGAGIGCPSLLAQSPSPAAAAPQADAPEKKDDVLQLNAFVVTGSITPRSRLETPLAITTIDSTTKELMAPRSIDELIKAIPGLYIESTGGEANNTMAARGVGAGNGFKYVAMLEDGLPVVSEEDMSFSTADNYTRVSTWIASIEGLRGGSSGVLVSNAPIGSINVIGREGTETPQGEYKLEFGDFGLVRADLWQSGPIDKDNTFALGGFYRTDKGIRSPGFRADVGGQLTANFKHKFANGKGYLKISGKTMDDRTEFLLPIPLTGTSAHPQRIPGGPSLHTGATASPDIRHFSFPNSPAGPLNYDLADGIQVDLTYIGSELEYAIGDGLKVQNRNRYTTVDKSWNANPFGQPDSLQNIANSLAAGSNAAGQYAAARMANGNYNFMLTYPGRGGVTAAANPTAAAALNGNGLGDLDGFWFSGAKIRDFQNDLRLIASFNNDNTTLTGGLYMKAFQETKFWQWQQLLIDVSDSYRRLDLTYLDATTGQPIGTYTYGGATQVGTLYRHGTANIDEVSPYVVFTHKIGNLSLDAGVRRMNFSYTGDTEGVSTYDLNSYVQSTAKIPALQNATFGNGQFTTAEANEHKTAYSVGANYTFNARLALFGRYSYGSRLPEDDVVIANGTGNTTPGTVETLKQGEVGVKYGRGNIGLFLTAFYMQQRNVLNNGFLFINNIPVQQSFTTGLNVPGLELESIWTPFRGFAIDARGTVQDPEIVTPGLVQIGGKFVSLDGLQPTRTPRVYGSITPRYTFPVSDLGTLTVNLGFAYTGSRPGNQEAAPNALPLKAFTEVSAGASFRLRNGLVFHLQVSNLLNNAGLTEQDPRLAGGVQVGNTFNARPLLPRSIVTSLVYRF